MEKLQPGDECEECLNRGLSHKLRYFYINLEEQLLKCESRQCLWPHNDEVSSEEEEEVEECKPITTNTNNEEEDDDEFIVQLLQQLEPAAANCSLPDLTSDNSKPESSKITSINSSNDKLLSTAITTTTTAVSCLPTATCNTASSMPNNSCPQKSVLIEQEIPHSIVRAASSSADSFDFKISMPELSTPLAIPKANLYQPPKKASTQQKQKCLENKTTQAASVATYMDALQRPVEIRPLRILKPARIRRSLVAGTGTGAGTGLTTRTQLVKQLMQSIEAKQKEQQVKTEAEQEQKQKQNQKLEEATKQTQ